MKPIILFPLALCTAGLGYLLGMHRSPSDATTPAVLDSIKAERAKSEIVSDASEDAARALLALVSPKRLEDFVDLHALLARLTPADFPKLIDTLGRFPDAGQNEKMLTLFRAWIMCDRNAARAWGLRIAERCAAEGFSPRDDSVTRAIGEEWCRQFRDDALELARKCWPGRGAGSVLRTVVNSCPKDGLAGCFATVQNFLPGRERMESIVSLFQNWGQMDRERALDAASRMPPGLERDSALAQVIVLDGQREPQKAFAQAMEFGLTDPLFLAALGKEAGVQKGPEISKWLVENAPELLGIAGPALASQWATKDPKAALSWALANGVSITKGGGGRSAKPWDEMEWSAPMGDTWTAPLNEAMRSNDAATVEWLRGLPAGADRDALIQQAATMWSGGPESLDLFFQLPAERQAASAGSVVRNAFPNQIAKAREWAATLPSGPIQDAAWRGLAQIAEVPDDFPEGRVRDLMLDERAMILEPDRALGLIAKITDPAARRRAFENVMWPALYERGNNDAAAARELMETSDFPAEWKASLGVRW